MSLNWDLYTPSMVDLVQWNINCATTWEELKECNLNITQFLVEGSITEIQAQILLQCLSNAIEIMKQTNK